MNTQCKIIDGKLIAEKLLKDTADKVKTLHYKLKIVVIIVGESPASLIYVNKKIAIAKEVGILSEKISLDIDISQTELIAVIEKLNNDISVNSILIQLPLPAHIDAHKIISSINPLKDVDGFHHNNIGKLVTNHPQQIVPCTPLGCYFLLNSVLPDEDLPKKKVCIIGRSNIVGKPLAQLLLNKNATVTIVHSKTPDIKNETLQADIIIIAIGKAKFLTSEYVKQGVIIIDVGINRLPGSKKIVGDVDFDSVSSKASFITKVPGGVGPMTIACLMSNTLKLAEWQNSDID